MNNQVGNNINNQMIPVQQNNQVNQHQNQYQQPSNNNSNIDNNGNQNIFASIPKGQLLSSNYQYQQQLQQIFILEQDCLKKCNEWFVQNNVTYKITHELVRFSTMLELEVFVVQTRNRIKQAQYNCFKYGSFFGLLLGTVFFYINKEKTFSGELVFRVNGLSAVGGGIFSYILSKQQSISELISQNNVNIDFAKFELFFESSLQDIYKLRKRLIQ